MYYKGELTREQMEEYNRDKCHYLWNPYVIDHDPNLTEEQKTQLKEYNKIWGD